MKFSIFAMVAALAIVYLVPSASLAQQEARTNISDVNANIRPLLGSDDKSTALRLDNTGSITPPTHVQPKLKSDTGKSYGDGPWAGNPTKFFEGAFIGFAVHESGHLITNYSMNTDVYLKSVNYGPIPFFTIQPGRPLNRHEHYITASAGFNATNIVDEWLLTTHPNLSQENKPLLKGLASFSFWLNAGYAATAFAGTGPNERDTKGMADALGWSEWEVGAMILVPTALDTYRYKQPDAKWAVTLSRLSKLYMIFLAAKAHD